MALSYATAVPLGCKLHAHDHELIKYTNPSSISSSFFLGNYNKLYSSNTQYCTRAKLRPCFSSVVDNNGEISATLTNPSTVEQVVAPPQQPSVAPPSEEEASTMTVVLAPGLDPATITIPDHVKRSDFPPDFIFGASSSALQTEGNGKEGGRAASTWDSMIAGGGNGMAIDSYSLYQDDVKLLKDMGMSAYRFSISWSRILPYAGYNNSYINPQGIEFYNNLIDELLANDITPFVTMFHFDLPKSIQEKNCGFFKEDIIKDFICYADVCFENFGDRVKHWITLNEPYYYSFGCKEGLPTKCLVDSSNVYVATHNMILTHATTVQHYRDKYQSVQGGKIGISLASLWFEPYDRYNGYDIKAKNASLDMMLGWFMDPLVNGKYPKTMEEWVIGLPEFTPKQKRLVKGSYDFIGINYYTARYVSPSLISSIDTTYGQCRIQLIQQEVRNKEGKLIGPPSPQSTDFYVVPTGLRDLLLYIKHKYNNPEVYVTENGVPSTTTMTASIRDLVAAGNLEEIKEALLDGYRINYISEHLYNLREALADLANVKGYFVWALADNVEVGGGGYKTRYGLNYVDYLDRHRRYRKASSMWFTYFLSSNSHNNNNNNKKEAINLN